MKNLLLTNSSVLGQRISSRCCKNLILIQFRPIVSTSIFCAGVQGKPSKELSKKYSNTLFLPKTNFPQKVEGKKRVERDKELFKQCKMDDQYEWQRKNRSGPEFVLHDGPPYANGSPHLGHAVNKILKDITVRFQCSQGRKVHFVPGWDCHGLPIEMKAIKGPSDKKLVPWKVREIASKFAAKTVESQLAEFKSWGLLADWDNKYRTMDPSYVKNQLSQFFSLYNKGYIFREYMPVYWSPSSRTALAESELEYNPSHQSQAVYLRLPLTSLSPQLAHMAGGKRVYAVVWTTTPWSLVSNKAVCYNPSLAYSLVTTTKDPTSLYLVASDLTSNPGVLAALPELTQVTRLTGSDLACSSYLRPLHLDPAPLLPGGHVTNTSGTGLVHTAPAHGQDDYKVGMELGLSLECVVGEDGRYLDTVGVEGLEGLEVLGDGGMMVREMLGKDILYQETVTHSYPYDWRTKKPVIVRGSKQWFIDTNKLKERAGEVVKGLRVQPESAVNGFKGVIENRPYWCISRQRVWGTFIPVIYRRETGEPVVNQELLKRYEALVDEKGTGFWWDLSLEEILSSTSFRSEDYYREGLDILDIWFDSGISWSCVLSPELQPADLYLEGLDQFSGWFYSSLLTSLALTGNAPYKRLFVHGFMLDEQGKKMSKSLGNVISPKDVTDKKMLGVDVLRWWVASHASSSTSVHVGQKILEASKAEVDRIRNTVRFLLGQLGEEKVARDDRLFLLDLAVLQRLNDYTEGCRKDYENMEYNKVCLATLNFLSTLSSSYLHLVKDRLYCDGATSPGRSAGVSTLLTLARGLSSTLAPITPLLTEEIGLVCPVLGSPLHRDWPVANQDLQGEMLDLIQVLEKMRAEGKTRGHLEKGHECHAIVYLEERFEGVVEELMDPVREVGEVLGVASAEIVFGMEGGLKVVRAGGDNCLRCRRSMAPKGRELCDRCLRVLELGVRDQYSQGK